MFLFSIQKERAFDARCVCFIQKNFFKSSVSFTFFYIVENKGFFERTGEQFHMKKRSLGGEMNPSRLLARV